MRKWLLLFGWLATTCSLTWSAPAGSKAGESSSAVAHLPVREITVFKDGHAFVRHEGTVRLREDGSVVIGNLPTPVLGTYWPYSATPGMKLTAVTAKTESQAGTRPATTPADLFAANPGARVRIEQLDGKRYSAEIVGLQDAESQQDFDARALRSVERYSGDAYASMLAANLYRAYASATLVMLRTKQGVRVVPLHLIKTFTFKGDYKRTLPTTSKRTLLKLQLTWEDETPRREAVVGMAYLQRGIRWVPEYRVRIDGKGNARVQLQATLINELVDLEDVATNLVIGVPRFFFKDTPDPISLQHAFPRLSGYFREQARLFSRFGGGGFGGGGFGGLGGGALGGAGLAGAAAPDEEDDEAASKDVIQGDRNEDLFYLSVPGITLEKGAITTIPLTEYRIKYRDVYTVNISFWPEEVAERSQGLSRAQRRDLSTVLREIRARHNLRLSNQTEHPLTTGPAVILRNGRLLAQSILTFTPIAGQSDLVLTESPSIKVSKTDRETKRQPEAAEYQDAKYTRVDLAGKITVTNQQDVEVELEVTRGVPGNIDEAGQEGVVERLDLLEDDYVRGGRSSSRSSYPWINGLTGAGTITWKLRLKPGETRVLDYVWHYYS